MQLDRCRRYAREHGWNVAAEHEFQDVLSGSKNARPGYQALLNTVRDLRSVPGSHTPRVVVIVAVLDRLGRRLTESIRCRAELDRLGVEIHSVSEAGVVPYFVAAVLASLAQEEVRRDSVRVRSVHQHLHEQGWRPNGTTPWGYLKRPSTAAERAQGAPRAVIDIDPIAAPCVRQMFRRAARGESAASISRWVAGLPERARGSRVLIAETIASALRAPVYVARSPCRDGNALAQPVARWPRLVDDGTWSRVQALRKHRLRPVSEVKHVLAGFVCCSACGRLTSASIRPGHPIKYYCIYCRTPGGSIVPPDGGVLDRVKVLVATAHQTVLKRRTKFERAWKTLASAPMAPDASAAKSRLASIERRLQVASALFAEGALDEIGYRLAAEALSRDRDELQLAPSAREQAYVPAVGYVRKQILGWNERLARQDMAGHREVLYDLVGSVHFVRDRSGECLPEISWTPLAERVLLACSRG